jgi:tRNA-2-methylthio-N6-dimethylallyladenosine synthase
MADQIPKEVVQERYVRLVALVNEITLQENSNLIGREVNVLIAEGEGRKDAKTERMSGRAEDSRLVHVAVGGESAPPRPGDVVTARITHAAPHHLVADEIVDIRRTRAGDLSETEHPTGVLLGIPAVPFR